MPSLILSDSLAARNLSVDELIEVTGGPIQLDEVSAPGTPASGKVRLYAKSDGRLYLKDDTGSEVQLDPSGLAVLKSLYDASSILVANTNDTPVALSISAGNFIGRVRSGGNIVSLDPASALDNLSPVMAWAVESGLWYDGSPFCATGATASTAFTLAANRLYGFPFWLPKASSFQKIGVSVTGADAGKGIKLGLFSSDSSTLKPTSRLHNGGALDITATGSKEESASLSLSAGLYWLALISDSAAAVFTRRDLTEHRCIGASSTSTVGGSTYYSDAGSYAAGIPSSFGTPSVLTVGPVPRIMLQGT